MDSKQASDIASDTIGIIKAGFYTSPLGRRVIVGNDVIFSKGSTETFTTTPKILAAGKKSNITVVNQSAMVAASELTDSVAPSVTGVGILNFASGRNPGGGFLHGAIAQEECLARSSALFPCLESHEMYTRHRASKDPMYSATMIYSPKVLFFKGDDGNLLEVPKRYGVLTAPAVNAHDYLRKNSGKEDVIKTEMEKRIGMTLSIFALKEHDNIVLGAWGCGAFGNDPIIIARLFSDALKGPFKGAFDQVVFAVMDDRPGTPMFNAFQKALVG
jgi:uncharacterized protein (TIGR02452 family)